VLFVPVFSDVVVLDDSIFGARFLFVSGARVFAHGRVSLAVCCGAVRGILSLRFIFVPQDLVLPSFGFCFPASVLPPAAGATLVLLFPLRISFAREVCYPGSRSIFFLA
jgi:hypothetical protein